MEKRELTDELKDESKTERENGEIKKRKTKRKEKARTTRHNLDNIFFQFLLHYVPVIPALTIYLPTISLSFSQQTHTHTYQLINGHPCIHLLRPRRNPPFQINQIREPHALQRFTCLCRPSPYLAIDQDIDISW